MSIRAVTTKLERSQKDGHFDRRSWLMLGLASSVLIYSLVMTFYVALLPGDGWALHYDLTQPDPNIHFANYYGSTPSPLQSGDVLVAVEGKPIEQVVAEAYALRSPRPEQWKVGNTIAYTVERDGRELTLDVPIMRMSPQIVWAYLTRQVNGRLILPMSLTMIVLGLVVFLQRPRYLPAQLLLLFSWSLAGSQLGFIPTSLAILLDPFALFFVHTPLLFSVWQLTILPVIVHLLLAFPIVKPPLRRYPRLVLLALYLPAQLVP